jgi:hypothetical protein
VIDHRLTFRRWHIAEQIGLHLHSPGWEGLEAFHALHARLAPEAAPAFNPERWMLVCGLESGAVLRLGVEPEYSRCREQALAGADTVLMAGSDETAIFPAPVAPPRPEPGQEPPEDRP